MLSIVKLQTQEKNLFWAILTNTEGRDLGSPGASGVGEHKSVPGIHTFWFLASSVSF